MILKPIALSIISTYLFFSCVVTVVIPVNVSPVVKLLPLYTKNGLSSHLMVLLGGRVAEEMRLML